MEDAIVKQKVKEVEQSYQYESEYENFEEKLIYARSSQHDEGKGNKIVT